MVFSISTNHNKSVKFINGIKKVGFNEEKSVILRELLM